VKAPTPLLDPEQHLKTAIRRFLGYRRQRSPLPFDEPWAFKTIREHCPHCCGQLALVVLPGFRLDIGKLCRSCGASWFRNKVRLATRIHAPPGA
jgi:hypothetical protein